MALILVCGYCAHAVVPSGVFASVANGLGYSWPSGAYVALGADVDMGMWHDDGVYASFGLEHQIFRFSKMVFPVTGRTEGNTRGHFWGFKVDFAPLYDAIRRDDRTSIVYGYDGAGHPINGTNVYFDWYKNVGSRVYYLGAVPLVEAYACYYAHAHNIRMGRVKNIVGLNDGEVFWGDDAKFAPMAYWLSRDLLSGVIYTYAPGVLELQMAILSGNNPMKGYAHYLGGIQSPQLKANNTPTWSINARIYGDSWMDPNMGGFVFASYQANTMNSTWEDGLEDGKRHANVAAFGARWHYDLKANALWLTQLTFLGQYTCYMSGLSPKSAQNNGHPRFRTIRQRGFFLSAETRWFELLTVAVAFESMQRFDYNVYERSNWGATCVLPENSRQQSYILQATYAVNAFATLTFAYHIVRNPVPFVSDILDSRGDNRYKLTLGVHL